MKCSSSAMFLQKAVKKPLETKMSAVLKLKPPTPLKKLRSFLGSVHDLINFVSNLSKMCHTLRQLSKQAENIHFQYPQYTLWRKSKTEQNKQQKKTLQPKFENQNKKRRIWRRFRGSPGATRPRRAKESPGPSTQLSK